MKNEQTKPQIPSSLLYEDAENKIFGAVNGAHHQNSIPFYLLEGILTNILHQVREQAEAERENARRTYQKQMEEYEKAEEEKEAEKEGDS